MELRGRRLWVWLAALSFALLGTVLVLLRYDTALVYDAFGGSFQEYPLFNEVVLTPVDWLAEHSWLWQYCLVALALCLQLLVYTRNMAANEPGARPLSGLAIASGGVAAAPVGVVTVYFLVALVITVVLIVLAVIAVFIVFGAIISAANS